MFKKGKDAQERKSTLNGDFATKPPSQLSNWLKKVKAANPMPERETRSGSDLSLNIVTRPCSLPQHGGKVENENVTVFQRNNVAISRSSCKAKDAAAHAMPTPVSEQICSLERDASARDTKLYHQIADSASTLTVSSKGTGCQVTKPQSCKSELEGNHDFDEAGDGHLSVEISLLQHKIHAQELAIQKLEREMRSVEGQHKRQASKVCMADYTSEQHPTKIGQAFDCGHYEPPSQAMKFEMGKTQREMKLEKQVEMLEYKLISLRKWCDGLQEEYQLSQKALHAEREKVSHAMACLSELLGNACTKSPPASVWLKPSPFLQHPHPDFGCNSGQDNRDILSTYRSASMQELMLQAEQLQPSAQTTTPVLCQTLPTLAESSKSSATNTCLDTDSSQMPGTAISTAVRALPHSDCSRKVQWADTLVSVISWKNSAPQVLSC